MAKTSKNVPQKEKVSSSRPSGDKAPVEPPPHEYVPGPCVTKDAILRPSSGEERTKSPAISKFRVDLSQCEVELQKVSGERDALQLLCSQKDEVIKDLQADLAKAREEEDELDNQVSLVLLEYGFDPTMEANSSLSQLQQKLRSIKQKGSAQAKRVEELETRLAEAKAKIDSSKVMADKSIAVYRADTEADQMEAREVADTADTRAYWAVELARCRSRRETLEEIHA
ncbi:uncharacterized protein [Nicotiana tomentosiformis]|uniref:uncharacterized protein n=1 Tax=Nicotiana tomentosiformis TaxID=4098 RepID=UPI00388CB791